MTGGTGRARRQRSQRDLMVAIDRMAGRQHGLVTHAQIASIGISKGKLRGMLARGQLTRVSRGLYRLPGAPRTWLQAARAATLSGSGAVISHRAAARLLLGETQVRGGRIEVTARRGARRGSRAALTVHVSRRLSDADVLTRSGIPCTTPLRTLGDLAGTLSEAELEEVVCDFVANGLVSARSLCEYLMPGGPGAHRPGARALRRGVIAVVGSKVESVAEQRLLRLWRRKGLPTPETQYEVRDQGGSLVARVDLALRRLKIAVEMDSYRYHGDPASFHRDHLRTMRLAALGWRVIHVTPSSLRDDPEVVIRAIEAEIATAARAAARDQADPTPETVDSGARRAWRGRTRTGTNEAAVTSALVARLARCTVGRVA